MEQINVVEFSKIMKQEKVLLLDVRTTEEFELVNIGGTHIPLNELGDNLDKLDSSKSVYCLCHHGMRSQHAGMLLLQKGFSNVTNITGGIHAWSLQVDSSKTQY